MLKVDFSNEIGAPSPVGWTGWTGDNADSTSTTIDGVGVTLTNLSTSDHGEILWFGDYTAGGSDGLEDMIEDTIIIHGDDGCATGFCNGDILAIGMAFSGLMVDTQYEITTWHNHNWGTPTLDISVGGTVVADSLAHSYRVANSNASAKATFNFTTDSSGDSPEILFASEATLGDPGGNAHLEIVPHINGFELRTEDVPVIGFNQPSSSGFEDDQNPVLIEVALANPAGGATYTVDYAVTGGTADANDYTLAQPQRLTFNPGEVLKAISIDITQDGLDEDDESLMLELYNPTGGAKVGYPDYTYTIIDIRPKISFAVASSNDLETVTPALIEVNLNRDDYIKGTVRDTITVAYEATGGTAVNGNKYILAPGTLTFPPGVVTRYVIMDVVDDDAKIQPDENIVITLSNPGGPSVPGDITEHTFTINEDDEGIRWEGKMWYFTNENADDYRRLFINEDGDLEWWPQQKGHIVCRIPDQVLSQEPAVMEYMLMTDGPHYCGGCSCDCFEESITCVAGTSDFRVVLAEADGEYIDYDQYSVGNDIFRGYKGVQFRFGPNMNASPTRWEDCHGEVHKTGTINRKPVDSENLAHGNDDPELRVLEGFETPPGQYSYFKVSVDAGGHAEMSLNGRTQGAGGAGGMNKVDVFAVYMRNGRPYTRFVLRSLKECPGDFNYDLKVDGKDLKVIAYDWLEQGTYEPTGTEPDANYLAVHYSFDETSGSTAYDSSSPAYDGAVQVVSSGVPKTDAWDSGGPDAGCINFDGNTKVAVSSASTAFAGVSSGVTVALWVNGNAAVQPDAAWGMAFQAGKSGNDRVLLVHIPTPNNTGVMFESGGRNVQRLFWSDVSEPEWEGQWNHYVFTLDTAAGLARIYCNGDKKAERTGAMTGVGGISSFMVGNGFVDSTNYEYLGKIDDFRVYGYALLAEEVQYVANGGPTMVYSPPDSGANAVPDDIINLKDLAVLCQNWLNECEP
ncbi:MAG: Calx-beta domain-containing protein [Planctomycetota bacterium]